MDFVIDTTGNADKDNSNVESSTLADVLKDYKTSLNNIRTDRKKSEKDDIFKQFAKDMGWTNNNTKTKTIYKQELHFLDNLDDTTVGEGSKREIDKILEKSVISPEFETLHAVPPYEESKKKLLEERRKERAKTKGSKWFNLPATEMTEEVKHDLEVLQMRSVLDPKHFYKKNDLKVLPKYFQVGKVLDSPLDYYSGRLTKKERKKTLVDELLADAKFKKYSKRKYKEIIDEKQRTHYKAWRQAKKLKRKNKK